MINTLDETLLNFAGGRDIESTGRECAGLAPI
jgi:hypothetical protein